MILRAEEILAGYKFHARRYDLPAASERAVQAAIKAAAELAGDREQDEPAAVLFAFAR